jgi:hypothetical protein
LKEVEQLLEKQFAEMEPQYGPFTQKIMDANAHKRVKYDFKNQRTWCYPNVKNIKKVLSNYNWCKKQEPQGTSGMFVLPIMKTKLWWKTSVKKMQRVTTLSEKQANILRHQWPDVKTFGVFWDPPICQEEPLKETKTTTATADCELQADDTSEHCTRRCCVWLARK